jgi:predicted DNA-binding protein
MLRRPPYSPSRDLVTESVRVGLPLDTKDALTKAARRAGKSVSGFAREAVEEAIARGTRSKARP